MMRGLAGVWLCLAACAPASKPAPPPYALEPVVARELAALEIEVAREPAPRVQNGPALELSEARDLLGAVVGSEGKLRLAALDDLKQLGERVVPALRTELVANDDDPALRAAAVEALAEIATPSAIDALLERLERARREADPEPWMRAHCAWRLPLAKADWSADRLLLALKYESDYETVIWLARSLEANGSLAGVVGLDVIARGPNAERAAEATSVLQAWAGARGLAGPAELLAAYHGGAFVDREEPNPASVRARLATWKRIQSLSEWQLRGVDDARFVLVQSGPSAVDALARALHDENRYVRVHAAQVLERMGPRARAAVDPLLDALRERGLAPQAARALGRLGEARARPALAAELDRSRPFEVRVAAARALADLGADGVEDSLQPLLDPATPTDLRYASASALLSVRGFGDAGAELELVAAAIAANAAEAPPFEATIERWLARAGEPAAELRTRWYELASDPERPRKRAELLAGLAQPRK
ncbi:MAG: HEAT repeat domain-containing protein [Planctomycetes bacterium]|nr:HEAT repeat domain-containing protein [Planctomycetota bacterium]